MILKLKTIGLVLVLAGFAQAQQVVALPKGEVPAATALVSLHLKDAPAQQALEELNKLSSIQFANPNGSNNRQATPITIDADKQPFWQVAIDVLGQMQMRIEPNAYSEDPSKTVIYPTGNAAQKVPQIITGPLLVQALRVNHSHSIEYANPGSANVSFAVSLRSYLDPAIQSIGIPQQIEVTEAIDENGKSLVPTAPFQSQWNSPNNNRSTNIVELQAPLNYLVDQGKMLKSLKGNLHLRVPAKMDVWDIAEIGNATGATREFAGGKYTITGLSQQGNGYRLEISVDYDPAKTGARNGQNPHIEPSYLRSAIHITDATGRELRSNGWSSSGRTRNNMTLGLNYALIGEASDVNSLPAAIVWNIPQDLQEVVVPIEFKDLPIP